MFNPSGVYSISGYQEPKVFITPLALQKMKIYVDECKDEIGWLGEVIKEGNNYVVLDTLLFKQEVHATTTEINEHNLMEIAEEVLAQPDGVERYNRIKMWGHSHVNMGVTPSPRDDTQMDEFRANNEYFIRIIANKKGELKLDLFDYVNGMKYVAVKWEVMWTTGVNRDTIVAEMNEKVTKKAYTAVQYPTQRAGGYNYYARQGELDEETWWEKENRMRMENMHQAMGIKPQKKSKKKLQTAGQLTIGTSLKDIANKSADLFDVIGLTEDEVLEMDELVTVFAVQNFLEELLMMEVTLEDAQALKKLANEYVIDVYGRI